MKKHFDETLKQTNLASKNDIAEFIKKDRFNEKLRKSKTWTKHVEAEQKLNDHVVLHKTNKYLSREVKLISKKGLTKDLIDGYSIFNAAKHLSRIVHKII